MEFGKGGNGNGRENDDQTTSNSSKGKSIQNEIPRCLTPEEIHHLELFYKECSYPNENQRQQLSQELGCELKKITFWFQNKRNRVKVQNKKVDNNTLRQENERIRSENQAMEEALKNQTCLKCGESSFGQQDQRLKQLLQLENKNLKEKHARLTSIIIRKPVEEIQHSLLPSLGSSVADKLAEGLNPNAATLILKDQYFCNGVEKRNKLQMIEIAKKAFYELLYLLHVDEPVWIKSPNDGRHQLIIHRHSYDKLFGRPNHFTGSSTATAPRFESSRDSILVQMKAPDLAKMFMDPNEWMDLFPTIATKAKTLEVVDSEQLGGTLHLMYKELHILSPLVSPREFFFLRYCQQLDPSSWVVVDVSCNFLKEGQEVSTTPCWMLPSGCMIQHHSNSNSKVTWVEHVEVDDKTPIHPLFRDLICRSQAFGAKSWLHSLQRTCERISYSGGVLRLLQQHERPKGVTMNNVPSARENLIKLSTQMVKRFWAMLSMPKHVDIPDQLSEMHNDDGVRVSVRKNTEPRQPEGIIVCAAASFGLPVSSKTLFNFFKDERNRSQWDIISNGNAFSEIANISCGSDTGNRITFIRPIVPEQNTMALIQESCIDPLGTLIVYAPIDLHSITSAINGMDPATISLLPSGIIISENSGPIQQNTSTSSSASAKNSLLQKPAGSLVTLVFQVQSSCETATNQTDHDLVAAVSTLINSTVKKIKVAFGVADLD